MRLTPAPSGHDESPAGVRCPKRVRFARPTVVGVATAGASLLVWIFASILLVIPSVFYVIPLPEEADGLTLCLPGLGPLQRVREGLPPAQEELAYIHEGVHAEQCRANGALWYARRTLSPQGRLTLEAQALCQEVSVLSRRGGDPGRLVDAAVAALVSDYFEEGRVSGWEAAAAVEQACGPSITGPVGIAQ